MAFASAKNQRDALINYTARELNNLNNASLSTLTKDNHEILAMCWLDDNTQSHVYINIYIHSFLSFFVYIYINKKIGYLWHAQSTSHRVRMRQC